MALYLVNRYPRPREEGIYPSALFQFGIREDTAPAAKVAPGKTQARLAFSQIFWEGTADAEGLPEDIFTDPTKVYRARLGGFNDRYGDIEYSGVTNQVLVGYIPAYDVLGVGVDDPPIDPEDGDSYTVGKSPTGAWSSFTSGDIAQWVAALSGWSSVSPVPGTYIEEVPSGQHYVWNVSSGDWVESPLPIYLTRGSDGTGDRLGFYFFSDEQLPGRMAMADFLFTVVQYSTMAMAPAGYFYPGGVGVFTGVMVGLIYGPTGQALYVMLEDNGGSLDFRIIGPPDGAGNRYPNILINTINWVVGDLCHLRIVFSPQKSVADVYVGSGSPLDNVDLRLVSSIPLGNINRLLPGITVDGEEYDESILRSTALIGVDGNSTDDSIIPFRFGLFPLGDELMVDGVSSGGFPHVRRGTAFIALDGEHTPDVDSVSPWFHPTPLSFPEFPPEFDDHPLGPVSLLAGELSMAKTAEDQLNIFFRHEPGLVDATASNMMLDFTASGVEELHPGAALGNMGFRLNFTNLQVDFQFLDDFADKDIGILTNLANRLLMSGYTRPAVPVDWTAEHRYRLLLNSSRAKLEVYLDDDDDPVISLDPATLPVTEAGWPESVSFGHLLLLETVATLSLRQLSYSMDMISYEAIDGLVPGIGWSVYGGSGSDTITPENWLEVDDPTYGMIGSDLRLHRHDLAYLTHGLGVMADFKMFVNSWISEDGRAGALNSLVPAGLSLYDTTDWLLVTFVDAGARGKYLVIPGEDVEQSIEDAIAQNTAGRLLSVQVDWTQPHEYRVLWLDDGISIFIDDMLIPALVLPEGFTLPSALLPWGGGASVFFGAHGAEIATTSTWRYVRVFESAGFDFSVRQENRTEEDLNKIWDSYAGVVLEAGNV